MKKPKVVSYENNIITLRVDGRLMSYLVDRPRPLGPADATLLRGAMDGAMVKALLSPMFDLVEPRRSLFSWFRNLWRREDKVPYSYEFVADYIEKVGVEIDVGKAKALVIPRSDVDKIRKGDIV